MYVHGGLLTARNTPPPPPHHHHQQQVNEKDFDHSPPRTPKLFRPYLDAADDSPTRSPGVQAEPGGSASAAGEVGSSPVERTATTTTTSTDGGSPQVTSALQASTRKYGCDLCGRMFSRSNTLVTHRVCYQTYVTFSSLSTALYRFSVSYLYQQSRSIRKIVSSHEPWWPETGIVLGDTVFLYML